VFFRYLSRHPDLLEEELDEGFFSTERTRALVGVALYTAAGVLGCSVAPPVAPAIFFALPIFYGFTSEGLYELPRALSRS
jgi:hypothetical protein